MEAPINTPISTPTIPPAQEAIATPPVASVETPTIPAKKGFFKEITVMDVGMIAIFIIAMAASVYSSYKQLLIARKIGDQNRKDIDELKSNVQSIMGSNYQPQ